MILKHKDQFDVEVQNVSNQYGQLAIQGPKARNLINDLVDVDVTEMGMFEFKKIFNYLGQTSFYLNLDILEKMVSKFIVILMIQKNLGWIIRV